MPVTPPPPPPSTHSTPKRNVVKSSNNKYVASAPPSSAGPSNKSSLTATNTEAHARGNFGPGDPHYLSAKTRSTKKPPSFAAAKGNPGDPYEVSSNSNGSSAIVGQKDPSGSGIRPKVARANVSHLNGHQANAMSELYGPNGSAKASAKVGDKKKPLKAASSAKGSGYTYASVGNNLSGSRATATASGENPRTTVKKLHTGGFKATASAQKNKQEPPVVSTSVPGSSTTITNRTRSGAYSSSTTTPNPKNPKT